jgi:hypothetical protein
VTAGRNGRAVIRRGEEQVILQPLTRLVLTRATPGATNILQSAGSALYRIGKKKTPHFQVDTPYLAALVKGTAFTVTVNRTRADVMVTEGAVEVSSREGSAVSLVKTGMTASVSRAETRAIDLQERSGTHRLVTTNEGGWSGTGTSAGTSEGPSFAPAPAATRARRACAPTCQACATAPLASNWPRQQITKRCACPPATRAATLPQPRQSSRAA